MIDPVDPVDTIKSGLQALDMGRMTEAGFDVNAHHERLLTTGPYAEANKRQSIWTDLANRRLAGEAPHGPFGPIQLAMNANEAEVYDQSLAEQGRGLQVGPRTTPGLQKLDVISGDQPKGVKRTAQELEAIRASHLLQEKRLGFGRTSAMPTEDLDAIAAAEDARLAREKKNRGY